jgi:hypothetical protein
VGEPGEEVAADVDDVCRWAGNVDLVQRAVAIAHMAGATPHELYDVAEEHGFDRAELNALLIDRVGP